MLVGRPRSRGCFLCRKRKVKCHETKPSGRNCFAYGQECPGYQTTVPLIFRENHKVERLVRKDQRTARTKAQAPTTKPTQLVARTARPLQRSESDKLTIPRFLLDSSWEHHGHCYFLNQFTLPTEADGSQSGRAALDAASFASLANRANVPTLTIQARRKYGQASRELNLCLGSVEDAIRNETLGAIVLLMLFEDINSERHSLMSIHVSGIQYLLKLRGPGQLEDPAMRSLFHFAFTQMVIQFMGLRDPMQIDLDWLLEVLVIQHPIYNMMAGNINISKFCAAASQVILKCDSADPPDAFALVSLLDRGEHLDLEFSRWFQGLPEAWLPQKACSSTGDAFILYADATSAGVWNYYHGTRIILQQTILGIYHSLNALVGGRPSLPETRGPAFSVDVPEEIIKEMVSEICETLPFAMGDVDLLGRPAPHSNGTQTGIKAVQGFAPIWPLFSVSQSGYSTEIQAREALRRIASTHGIRLGLDLSYKTVQLDRIVSASSSRSSRVSDVSLGSD